MTLLTPSPAALRTSMTASTRAAALLFAAAVIVGCSDKEFITIGGDIQKRPIGDACVVDDECDTGRCVAGACSTTDCINDDDCRNDEICVLGTCEDADDFACEPGQAPILSLSTTHIEFDQVAIGQVGTEIVTVENIGDCLLTLSSAGLDDAGDDGFDCEPCDPQTYPQRIPPQRTLDIEVAFSPTTAGEKDSTLFVDSDDASAGDDGQVSISLHGDYDGTPQLVISPSELNFGFVEFAVGGAQSSRTETIEITNRGTGNAALVIERIFMDEGIVFHIPDDVDAISPDAPLLLPPYDANDPATVFTVAVTFSPDDNREFDDRLIVRPLDGDPVPVLLAGNALGPPVLHVSTDALEFRCLGQPNDACPVGDAYPVGFVAFRQVFVQNQGQSEMPVNLTLSSGSGDFTVSPSFLPPLQPGATIPLTVIYNPSEPSDPANPQDPQQPVTGFLNILEPTTGTLETVSLAGFARRAQSDAVLKLEMEFTNADNSWAGSDFRDVDLELESPTGFSCAKPIRTLGQDPQGNVVVTGEEDLCDEWNNAGLDQGQVNWIALGQYEEPERVLLYGLGPAGANGQTFTARAHYIEDCANLPTGLLADILGIGGSILLGILGGAVGVPISVPPENISDLIESNCFDHAGSTVTLHISLDGETVSSPQMGVDYKGQFVDLAHLQRLQGTFCDPAVQIPCP